MKQHLNYIILHDGSIYHLFERLGKDVPLDAYNPENSIFSSENLEEVLENRGEVSSKSWGSLPENLGKSKRKSLGIPKIGRWEIEEKPYEVMFNGEH